ncbi:hypothetical protein FI667_g2158, partial [Globisporangium splendens]
MAHSQPIISLEMLYFSESDGDLCALSHLARSSKTENHMSKKKRATAAHASAVAAANNQKTAAANGSVAVGGASAAASSSHSWSAIGSSNESVEGLLSHYAKLAHDGTSIPLMLELSLWTHNVMLMVVQHTLVYDKDVAQIEQLWPLLWTGFWLGRSYFAAYMASSPVAITGTVTRSVVLWRIAAAALGVTLQVPCTYNFVTTQMLLQRHLFLLLLVLVLDLASIILAYRGSKHSHGKWLQVALAMVEVPFLISIFSVPYSPKEFLVVDRASITLTNVTASIQTGVVLTAKAIACSSHGSTTASNWSQQRGRSIVKELRDSLEWSQQEPEGDVATVTMKKTNTSKCPPQQSDASESAAVAVGDATTQEAQTADLWLVVKCMLELARVRLALLVVVQACLVFSQLVLSMFVLLAWELASANMLWTLVHLQQMMSRPRGATDASTHHTSRPFA